VHHVAFRAKDGATQAEMAAHLRDRHGLQPTEQKDRRYFRSVYFLEPGGILFEIATDEPGFTVDEAAPTLGKDLKLPPFLELGIPTMKTTGSDAWRPSIPIDDDQGARVRGGTVGCIC
jgi:hypothetical protein